MATTLQELRTPAFIVDKAAFQRNSQRMIEKAKALNLNMRPHVKTHKTWEGVLLQLGVDQFNQIVCSTLKEVEFYLDRGIKDIAYGLPISPDKLPAIADFSKRGTIHIFIDSKTAFDLVEDFAKNHNTKFSAFLKIDTGYGRAGVPLQGPHFDASIELARLLSKSEFIEFYGLYSHSGHSYVQDPKAVSFSEADRATEFANRLKEEGISVGVVSVGATPSCWLGEDFRGCTEIHPGNYIFNDTQQVAAGSCKLEDCAGTVLTRVISHKKDDGTQAVAGRRFLIDAGALALSKDLSPVPGFGLVLGHPELAVIKITQEIGLVEEKPDASTTSTLSFEERFPIGSLLRIVPNHSCLTSACFERLHVVEDGAGLVADSLAKAKISAVWERCNGW